MRVIIAGGRHLVAVHNVPEVARLVAMAPWLQGAGCVIDLVLSGACGIDADDPKREEKAAKGADGAGELWARAHGISIERHYAAFKREGPKAGPLRNAEMAEIANGLLWLPGDRGTASMIREARRRKLPIFPPERERRFLAKESPNE